MVFERGGLGGPPLAVTLVRSLMTEWGGSVQEFDAPPGGPITIWLVFGRSSDGQPATPRRAWARCQGTGVAGGWAVQKGPNPGERFAALSA